MKSKCSFIMTSTKHNNCGPGVYLISLISIQLKNNGTCFDRNGEIPFVCDCDPTRTGYYDETCEEYDICNTIECINGGNCTIDDTDSNNIKPKCDCPKDEIGNELFYGETCNILALCPGDPCQNGGKCIKPFDSNSPQDCIAIQI